MRAQKPFAAGEGSLIGSYSAKLAEAFAVRRAERAARAARAAAELSIRARSEFLSNMNHELRTPLNAIIGFATMLRDTETYELSDEQRRSYSDYVLQSADLLLGHINTILEAAALDSGNVEMAKREIDFVEVLDKALARASIAAAGAGVTLIRRDAAGPILGWGDAQRFSQALDHLLRTAIKSSEKGGRVFARAGRTEQEWPEIAIRDHSKGLDHDAVDKTLSVFDEVHRGLDRSFAGPGVGLAIAKTFVEMQGGRFDLKSRPGQGTIARMSLPPAKIAAAPAHVTQSIRLAG